MRLVLPALLSVNLLASACGDWQSGKQGSSSLQAAAALYGGERLGFSTADFLKPRPGGSVDVDIYQAPLILQEVVDIPTVPAYQDRFGAVINKLAGESTFDPQRPAVYYTETSSLLDGHEHRQRSYVWLYSRAGRDASVQRSDMQGLRLTLDRKGHPVVIEVLRSPGEFRVVYVSRSLETAASREFGAPLPGRRYAVERSIDEQPGLVVVGVIEDSPEPLGPVVYLHAGSREVGAITCRCMPSQVKEIRETEEYDIEPLEKLLQMGVGPLWDTDVSTGSDSTRVASEGRLPRILRLPSDF